MTPSTADAGRGTDFCGSLLSITSGRRPTGRDGRPAGRDAAEGAARFFAFPWLGCAFPETIS